MEGRRGESGRKGRTVGALKWLSLGVAASRRHGRRCRVPLPRKGDKLQGNRLQGYSLKGAGASSGQNISPPNNIQQSPGGNGSVCTSVFLWCACVPVLCVYTSVKPYVDMSASV